MSERALILAPWGRDGALTRAILAEAGLAGEVVGSLDVLVAGLREGASFAVIAEEALTGVDVVPLRRWLDNQPEWSDFPFIMFTQRAGIDRNPAAARYGELLGNVSFIERPFHPTTLVALARAAVRGRRKQYGAQSQVEALHRSEERFRAAINAVQGVLWTNNADGRMEGEQPAWAALTGQSFEAYQGFGWSNAVHPDDAQPTIDAWNKAVVEERLFEFEHRVRTRDGDWRSFSIRAIPTFTTDGTLREWVGVHTDVTHRRATEATLHELNSTLAQRVQAAVAERHIFANIIETSDSYTQVLGSDMQWLAINHACVEEFHRIYGRRPQVGELVTEVLAEQPEHAAQLEAIARRALAGETVMEIATFGDPAFGRNRYEVKYGPLRDADGTLVGAFQVATNVEQQLRDAEQLAQTQDALRQAQKMEAIGQLTGGVAHDFNNLLTIIRGGAEYLRRPDARPERQQLYADAIFEAADRAAKLTQQLLAFSRRQPLRPSVFDLGARVVDTADMLRSIVGGRITMDVTCDPGLFASADIAQFETALVNLCVNARDAMDGEGRLTIRAYRCDGEVCVDVEDEGHGIAPEVLPRLFEPFFTTKEVGKGTGLGLSQVYGFTHQSGGDVRVASTLDVGTCFTLSLPVASAPEDVAAMPANQPTPVSRRIMLVEDNDDLRTFATALLEELGHDVESARSAHEALGTLSAAPERFDVLFTDVVMAGMSGLDLARHVRKSWPDIKIVLASGYSDALLDAESLDFPLVGKPYGAAQLAAVL